MRRDYNRRRLDYEKAKDRLIPASRRCMNQMVHTIMHGADPDEVDVPLREVIPKGKRTIWRNHREERESLDG